MRKLEMVLVSASAVTITAFHLISAMGTEGASKRDRQALEPYVVTMSHGSYSTRMSSDRKTVIQTADGKVVAEEIYSPNKKCYAFADHRTKVTTIYEVVRAGNVGRRVALWTMDGCREMVGLSNGGRCLVLGHEGGSTIPIGFREDEPILSFITAGEPTGRIGLDRIITDFAELERNGSGYYWGRYLGFNAAGGFAVETAGGELILFDIERAERISYGEAPGIPRWKSYRDLLRCYEYCYPETLMLEEASTYDGRPAGRTALSRRDGKTIVRAEVEQPGTYPSGSGDPAGISFEDFAVGRAKLRCSADGPTSSIYAGDVAEREVFVNPNGRTVVRFSLSIIEESYDEGTVSGELVWGPYYAVSVSQEGEPYRFILLELSDKAGPAGSRDEELLRRIVDTARILP